MKKQLAPLESLTPIQVLMARSSRFISLSGLPGICAGTFALAGTAALAYRFDLPLTLEDYQYQAVNVYGHPNLAFYRFIVIDALLILVASLTTAILLTTRQARQNHLPVWDKAARRVFWSMFIPLSTGGIFCLVLLMHHMLALVVPATLLFYGLALLNTSKYTLPNIRYLALSEISLGLVGSYFIGYGLLFWAIGFGLFHILYGIRMYPRYKK